MNKHSPTGKRRRGTSRAQFGERLYDTPDQFCHKTNTSRSTVWRMMRDGRLRYVKFGPRLRRIPTSEYERLGLVEAAKAEEM
jgi:excisionase family DNA binding protein